MNPNADLTRLTSHRQTYVITKQEKDYPLPGLVFFCPALGAEQNLNHLITLVLALKQFYIFIYIGVNALLYARFALRELRGFYWPALAILQAAFRVCQALIPNPVHRGTSGGRIRTAFNI